MSEPKWLKDKNQWTLSDTFVQGPCKTPHPKVGDHVNGWLIIGAWVDERGFLKAYKVQCACGSVVEYTKLNNLKRDKSRQCQDCAYETKVLNSTLYFEETYGRKRGEKLRRLYIKRFERNAGVSGPKFYGPWKTDYVAFAEYIVALPGFDRWPELSLDRYPVCDGAYEPGNVRFATKDEQMANRTVTLYVEFDSNRITMIEFIKLVLGPEYKGSKPCGWIYNWRNKSASQITESLAKKVLLSRSHSSAWPDGPTKTHFIEWYTGYNNRKKQ